jgi:hypothetical protein
MRQTHTIYVFLMVFAMIAFVVPADGQAEEAEKATFVDLDGDGFDDNLADSDENGIPDQAEPDESESGNANSAEGMIATLNPINVSSEDLSLDQILTNSEKFGKREFNCRDHSCFRGGFDAGQDFGPGNGISSAAVSSGCAGGICH